MRVELVPLPQRPLLPNSRTWLDEPSSACEVRYSHTGWRGRNLINGLHREVINLSQAQLSGCASLMLAPCRVGCLLKTRYATRPSHGLARGAPIPLVHPLAPDPPRRKT